MSQRARLRRLERALLGGFASESELDAAIEAELNKLEPGERERYLLEFQREEGLTAGRRDGKPVGETP